MNTHLKTSISVTVDKKFVRLLILGKSDSHKICLIAITREITWIDNEVEILIINIAFSCESSYVIARISSKKLESGQFVKRIDRKPKTII